jgi:hypothetical protein
MDAMSSCLTDPDLQKELTHAVQLVGTIASLCGLKDPWAVFAMMDKQPQLLEVTPAAVAARMLALRRVLPGTL